MPCAIRQRRSRAAGSAAEILGLPGGDHIRNVTLEDVTITSATGLRAENLRGLNLARVNIAAAKPPPCCN